MATMFETAMRGYQMMDSAIKEKRGYDAAVEKFGVGPASDPELFNALKRDARADEQLEINKNADRRYDESHNQTMQNNDIARDEDGMLKMVNFLRQQRDTGADMGEAFDKVVDTLPNYGVAEEDLPALREQLIEDPSVLDGLYQSLADPKDVALAAKAQQKASGALNPAEMEEFKNNLGVIDDLLGRIDDLESPEYAAVGGDVFGMPTPGKAARSGGFGRFGTYPGSKAADFVNQLTSLENDIRSAAFEKLKGGGHITEAESKFAADAIARIDRQTSYAEAQREMKRLRRYMMKVRANAIRRAGGENIPELQYGPQDDPNYPSAKTTNVVYVGMVDPATKRIFTGGDPTDGSNWAMPTNPSKGE